MAEPLFNLSAEYEQMLNQGIRLSGESREFFMKGRVKSLLDKLPVGFQPQRILDYGCGTGDTSAHLAATFEGSEVLGVDTSENVIAYANDKYGSRRVRFRPLEELSAESDFDLCYVNGVFHHIELGQRPDAIAGIRKSLRRGGCFALFENNPWNPGTRMVMARIPFDRDARTLSPVYARTMLCQGGFSMLESWSLFYFPRSLAFLRPLERRLAALPLGAQYCVLATRADA